MAEHTDAARYLEEIQAALVDIKQQRLSEDDRRLSTDVLLSNALKELGRDPVVVLCDPENSRVFESLLGDTSCGTRLLFLEESSKRLYEICSKFYFDSPFSNFFDRFVHLLKSFWISCLRTPPNIHLRYLSHNIHSKGGVDTERLGQSDVTLLSRY